MTYLLLLAGLVLLIAGAEVLVRGASRLAAAVGISPLIVGLTVVAFGTSAPEFAVTVKAALADQAGIALGNVVGSNIFNVLFILGLSALVAPLVVTQQLVRVEVPLMIGVAAVTLFMALDGTLGWLEGALLFGALLVYVGFLIRQGRRAPAPDEEQPETGRPLVNVLQVVGGLAMLVLGARWLVDGAVTVAQQLGVSEVIIGLTVVAAGTSMPEVVTSVVAGLRGARDIAVGNVVGSNLFNNLGVLGLAALLDDGGLAVLPSVVSFDLPVMLAASFACLPIFFTGGVISRWEGGVLMGYYVAYTAFLILAASAHDALPVFSNTMLYFVIPLTAITLGVLSWQAVRRNRQAV